MNGARVHGTIPVAQDLANAFLHQFLAREKRVQELHLIFQNNNRVAVRCKLDVWWLPVLSGVVALQDIQLSSGGPVLIVRPASVWSRIMLTFVEQIARMWSNLAPVLFVQGGNIYFRVAALPAVAPYRFLFPYLREARWATRSERLYIGFSFSVE